MSQFILPTFTGIEFDLENPTVDMICIADIAHHLSQINRFCGATRFPYSVGLHSILVCEQTPIEFKLESLLHDAAEAYIHDLTAPLKALLNNHCDAVLNHNSSCYAEIDETINYLIETKFDLHYKHCNGITKKIDLRMGVTEINQLLFKFDMNKWMLEYQNLEPYPIQILELPWWNVEELFLKEFEKYRRDK